MTPEQQERAERLRDLIAQDTQRDDDATTVEEIMRLVDRYAEQANLDGQVGLERNISVAATRAARSAILAAIERLVARGERP